MERKKKLCKCGCGKMGYIWARGMLKECSYKDKKPKGLKKISEKGKVKKELKKDLVYNDMAFYFQLWQERPHQCFETNKPLGPKPLITYFHHVLPKQTYPQYRHCAWNIVLLHPDTHNQVETCIDYCPKVKALTEKLKEEHLAGLLKVPTQGAQISYEELGEI